MIYLDRRTPRAVVDGRRALIRSSILPGFRKRKLCKDMQIAENGVTSFYGIRDTGCYTRGRLTAADKVHEGRKANKTISLRSDADDVSR